MLQAHTLHSGVPWPKIQFCAFQGQKSNLMVTLIISMQRDLVLAMAR